MNFLACDIGGTKVLLGIYEKLNSSRIPKLVLKEKYFSNEWDSFYSILDDFFKKQSLDISTLKSACFAIAGPVKGDNCKLTNLPWNISRVELKNKLYGFVRVTSDRGLNANLWNLSALPDNNQQLYYSILLQVTLEKINREMPGCSISVQAPLSSFKSLEESGFILDPNGIRVMGYKL